MSKKHLRTEEVLDLVEHQDAPKPSKEEASSEKSSCRATSCDPAAFRIWIAVFVIVIVQIVSTAFFSERIVQSLKEFEYAQRGGRETFELLNKAQILQVKGQIEEIKKFVENAEKNGANNPGQNNAPAADESKTMSMDEVSAITNGAYFQGNQSARIVAVEYTDPECPFCIRQSKDETLKKLLEKYPDQVKVAHKPMRAVDHPGSEAKSVGLLCAGKIAGADAYNAFYKGIMDRSTPQAAGSVSDLPAIAKEAGVNAKEFAACTEKKEEALAQYAANTAEGNKYGVNGTPGTMVIDTQTGKYQLIAGAYPFDTFDSAVAALLK